MNNSTGQIQLIGMGFVAIVMLLCYGIMPFIGGGILIFFDYAAYGFRWVGIGVPLVGWALLGAVAGGAVGLIRAMRRVGIGGLSIRTTLWCAGGFALLYALSFLYCNVMKPIPVRSPTVVPTGRTLPAL